MTYISTQILALLTQRSATPDSFYLYKNPSTYRIRRRNNNFTWQELQHSTIVFISTQARHSSILPLGSIVIQVNLTSLIIVSKLLGEQLIGKRTKKKSNNN